MTIAEFTPKLRYRIAMAIEESGMPAKDVAKVMGVSPSTLSRWKTGQVVPDAFELMRIAEATNCEWLLDLRGLPSGCKDVLAGQAA